MKKLFLVFALGLGLATFAQQKDQMAPEQLQKKHLDKLTKELNLDAKQQQQVAAIMTEKSAVARDLKAQHDAIKSQKANGEKVDKNQKQALKSEMEAQKQDLDTKMKAVLNQDQYQKWLAMKEERKEKMKEKKKQM